MKKKITGIFLVVMMLFSLVGCNNDTMQTKIDELEAKIEAQDEELSNLQEENAAQDTAISELKNKTAMQENKIADLENDNRILQGKIWDIENAPLYNLEEVYEASRITKQDLLNIAYYNNNGKLNEELMGENFVPDTYEEDKEILLKILNTLVAYHKEEDIEVTREEILDSFEYYGCYNGFHAFTYRLPYMYPAVVVPAMEIDVGGVMFYKHYTYSFVMLWKDL